ncbi:MAG: hypothetical protein WC782_10340 [Methylococcaceae bacterium]|jgi:hypothetical protein
MSLPEKLIIMYHSVSSPTIPEVVGSFPIPMARFQYQVQSAMALGYTVSPITELLQPNTPGQRQLFITGDDGTVDWTRNVLPWCEANKLPSHTAIIAGPWLAQPIYPLAHLIQVILSVRSETELEQLAKQLQSAISPEALSYLQKVYAYESTEARRIIKGACNLILEPEQAYEIIGECSQQEQLCLAQRFEVPSFYQALQFADVGVHTVSHKAMGKNIEDYCSAEIDTAKKLLLKHGLKPSSVFTLPMKPRWGVSVDDLIPPLTERGYQGILYSEYALWNQHDFVVPRIDAKHVEDVLNIPSFAEAIWA